MEQTGPIMNEVCPPGPWLDREMKGRLTGMHLYEQWMSIKDQLFEMNYNILYVYGHLWEGHTNDFINFVIENVNSQRYEKS